MFRQIGQKPPSSYSDPVGMMEDCHQRIRFFLSTLSKIGDAPDPLHPDHADALRKALVYFRDAAPRHTADEEESLFPRLRRLNDPRVVPVENTIRSLEQEHVHADAAQKEIDDLGQRWLKDGSLSEKDRAKWRAAVADLRAHYEQHISIEERVIFKLAKEILPAAQQQEIGQEMAQRRGAAVTNKP